MRNQKNAKYVRQFVKHQIDMFFSVEPAKLKFYKMTYMINEWGGGICEKICKNEIYENQLNVEMFFFIPVLIFLLLFLLLHASIFKTKYILVKYLNMILN